MQMIRCPHCGPREETEFHYGAAAGVAYPDRPADLDELLSAALGAAMEHLEKNGEFYPFAMSVDGEPTIDSTGEPTAASNQAVAPDVDIVFADPAALGEQPEFRAFVRAQLGEPRQGRA